MPRTKRTRERPSEETIKKMQAGRRKWCKQLKKARLEAKAASPPPPPKASQGKPKQIVDPEKSKRMKKVWQDRYQKAEQYSQRATNAAQARVKKMSASTPGKGQPPSAVEPKIELHSESDSHGCLLNVVKTE